MRNMLTSLSRGRLRPLWNPPVIALHASTWSRRSGPYDSLELCVDRFAEAARRFRGKEPEQLRWGTRIENPGVMDLIEVEDVIERLQFALEQRQARH